MKSSRGILLALMLLSGSAAAASAQNGPPAGARPGPGAQQPGGAIRGVVRDAAGQPVKEARIAVWSLSDSTLVTGGVSGADGAFRIEGLRPGGYYLRVTMLGFSTGRVDRVAVAGPGQAADAGEVKLQAQAVALEGISATAERAEVTQSVDRTVFSARNLPAAAGGNATDVLRNVPGVEVDADGKVSVRGNQNVAIQINGRPAPLTGDALTNFIKQLPANLVDRVEVIPNPSAKYDPDGMGGILNIVLKQDADLGTSGGVNLGMGTGGKYNFSGNLGHQSGNLTLFGSYGLFAHAAENTGYNNRENRFRSPITYLDQDIFGENESLGHNVSVNADLKLGKTDVLSATGMAGVFGGDMESRNVYTELDAARAVTGRYDRETAMSFDNAMADFSLAYRRTLVPQRNELSAEVRRNFNRDDNRQRFSLFPRSLTGGVLATDPTEIETSDLAARTNSWTFQLDYTRGLTSALKLETGYKGTLRELDNDFATERTAGGVVLPGGSADNAFLFSEDVHAGYAILTQDFGKVDVQAGARLERAFTTFDLTTTDETFDNDYTSLFPSASVMYAASDTRTLKASYSKRIQRPDTWLLNPFPRSEDPLNRFQGNPHLRPEYTHSFELSLQQGLPFGSLTVTPFYRRTEDAVRRYKSVDENGVSTTTFRNLATAESYGADVTNSIRLGDRFSGFVSGSAYRVVTDGSNVEANLGSDALSWSARGSLTYKLTPRLDVTWFQFYRAPQEVEQGRISGVSMANLALRHKLWGEKGSLSVRVADPFDQAGFRFQTADDTHAQDSRRKWQQRAVFLSFSYNFGQAPRLRPRPQDQPQQQPTGGDIGIN